MNNLNEFRIFAENEPGGKADIRPSEVMLGSISGKFEEHRVEESVENLLNFFQEKDMWQSFSFEELLQYCKRVGFNPEKMLFGLLGSWLESGSGLLREPQNYIVMDSNGRLCVTNSFIEKLK